MMVVQPQPGDFYGGWITGDSWAIQGWFRHLGLVTSSQCRLTVTAWASFPRGSSFLLHNRLGLLTLLSRLLTVCPGCNPLLKLIEQRPYLSGSFFPDITRTPYAFQNCWQCHPQVDVVNLDLELTRSRICLNYESLFQ